MQCWIRKTIWLLLAVMACPAGALAADSLDATELAELQRYLAELKTGGPGSAARVDQLADISFPGLLQVIRAYVELEFPIEAHTHRAFQALLERNTRSADYPWPMLNLYAPQFAQFRTRPVADNPLSQRLFDRLRESVARFGPATQRELNIRTTFDLAVRLTPEASLRCLASGRGRNELLDAWNRRLARLQERHPIPGLDRQVSDIAAAFSLDLPTAELESLLRFIAAWPKQRERYRTSLEKCLGDKREAVVLAGLMVQHRVPLLLTANEGVIERFAAHPKVVERALLNYVFDDTTDHSATLRRLWAKLPANQPKARRACLFAMGEHPKGNDVIALAAVLERSYDFIDVAMPILKAGDRARATQAIRHVLSRDERGLEEALRLARDLDLAGFDEEAARSALDERRDQILRQSALQYLQRADGKTRRRLLPLLAHTDADMRLTAIRMFVDKRRLTEMDMNEIGPALVRVALADRSHGHRQEAIYVLGCWREQSAVELLRKVLKDHLAVPAGQLDESRYWDYRLRLVALLGLTRLGDPEARKELQELHRLGGPAERMDVLLTFLDLGEVPEFAFADLSAAEPKLVATAATLIAQHGAEAARKRMRQFFQASPLWSEFLDSGMDDHQILRLAGVKNHAP